MRTLYTLLLVILMNSISFIAARKVEKSLSVYVIEETVNGDRFTHRSDFIDGKSHEIWAINNQQVPQEEYEEAILNAEREERRSARKAQEEKRKQEQEFKALAHYNLVKKCVKLQSADIAREVSKVREPLLASFLKFNESSISSEALLYELEQELIQVDKICHGSNFAEIKQLEGMLEKFEPYPEKLTKLYQDSINHAIKTCDNTRTLKELLTLVS
jgi:hypothetical protein